MSRTPLPPGWRVRPLRGITQSLLCLTAGVLLGIGLLGLDRAENEARALAEDWPAGHTTLRIGSGLTWTTCKRMQALLPPDTWTAYRIEGNTAWVDGCLDDSFRDEQGRTLLPLEITSGLPAALSSSGEQQIRIQGRRYPVVGTRTGFLNATHVIPAAAGSSPPRLPSHIRIRLPANHVISLLGPLASSSGTELIDHHGKRKQAMSRLRSLRLRFAGGTAIAALLVGMILITLWRSEMEERKVEFALRRSLGATPSRLHQELLKEAFWTCGAPLTAGLLIFLPAVPLGTLLSAATAGLGLLALVCALPAHHAAHRPPAETLQHAA